MSLLQNEAVLLKHVDVQTQLLQGRAMSQKREQVHHAGHLADQNVSDAVAVEEVAWQYFELIEQFGVLHLKLPWHISKHRVVVEQRLRFAAGQCDAFHPHMILGRTEEAEVQNLQSVQTETLLLLFKALRDLRHVRVEDQLLQIRHGFEQTVLRSALLAIQQV